MVKKREIIDAPRAGFARGPVHPGEILRKEIAARGLSANALGLKLQVPTNRLTEIINGKRGVSPETASRLGHHLGPSAAFWLNLQSQFDLAMTEKRLGAKIRAEVEAASVEQSRLAIIRDRLHRKAQSYFAFEKHRRDREKHLTIFGATDALLDASEAARAFSSVITGNTNGDLLVCFGFLQSLVVQQDAVANLSELVDLGWDPWDDKRLAEFRNVRNRLCGHPARADKPKGARKSSGIIVRGSIGKSGFKGAIYYEDGFESVDVDVTIWLADNETRLASQMAKIEAHMDTTERAFRGDCNEDFGSGLLATTFDYILRRTWCELGDEGRVPQAESHIAMIRDDVAQLKQEFATRAISPWWPQETEQRVEVGLNELERILKGGDRCSETQRRFDLLYDGTEKAIHELQDSARSLLEQLRAAVD
jgi:addiction module HigA family antidote